MSSRRLRLLAALVALLPFAWLVWRFLFVCDDAFISFRYARNLTLDRGLRFNVGVEPPVEGYSEFLWVLLMALGMKLRVAPELFSVVLSIAAGTVLVWLASGAIARAARGRPAATLGAALVLGALPPLAVWTTGGMGTAAFLVAAFGLHVALFGDPERPRAAWAVAAAVLVVLLRADGAYWVAASGLTGLALGRGRPRLRRAALFASVAAAAVFLAHVGWRFTYYGDWLPNTARVKVGLSGYALARGGKYLLHFLATFPGVALAIAATAILARRDRDPFFVATAVAAVASLLYPVVVGGDFMCFGRFVLPALPLVAVLLARGLAALEDRTGTAATCAGGLAVAALSLLPAFGLHAVPRGVRAGLDVRYNAPEFRSEYVQWATMKINVRRWAIVGRGLAAYTRPTASLVTGGIGAIGYYSDRFLYDQNGLVTREVALGPASRERRSPGHDKAVSASYFLKDAPTFLEAYLHDATKPLPPGVRPEGSERDLVRPLDPARGFPPGVVLIGIRPRGE